MATRLTSNQKIMGSTPIVSAFPSFFNFLSTRWILFSAAVSVRLGSTLMWFLLWCPTDELILKKRVIKDSLQSV